MMKIPFPHEREIIEICAPQACSCMVLRSLLSKVGFVCQSENVWSIERKDPISTWQTKNTAWIDIFQGQKEIYLECRASELSEENLVWDRLRITYLMTSIPESEIVPFIAVVARLSEELALPLIYRDQPISPKELQQKLHDICQFLEEEYGGAGSRTIGHFIEIHYM